MKKKMSKIVLVGGAMLIVILFVLFVPYILGATAAEGADLQKYNGTSQQGNDTVRAYSAMNTMLIGLTSISLETIAIFVAILCVIAGLLLLGYSGNKRK